VDVNDAADRLRQLLADAGFNSDRPDPTTAWAAFKRFAAEPVDAQTTELWFETGDGDPASDSPAYFDFVRMFMHYPDDGAEWGEQITAHFTAPPDVRLGLRARPRMSRTCRRGSRRSRHHWRSRLVWSSTAGPLKSASMGADPDRN
jgi:hypothetical protein